MNRRAAPARSGPRPATRGQWWFAGVGVILAMGCWAYTGYPGDSPRSTYTPRHISTTQSAPQVGSDDRNYPNVRAPNLRDGALTGGFCRRKSWC